MLVKGTPGGCCNIGYPYETHLKLKSREISFAQGIHSNCQIVLKIYTAHDNDTLVLCAKYENNLILKLWVMGRRVFALFELHMRFGWPLCMARVPPTTSYDHVNGPHPARDDVTFVTRENGWYCPWQCVWQKIIIHFLFHYNYRISKLSTFDRT